VEKTDEPLGHVSRTAHESVSSTTEEQVLLRTANIQTLVDVTVCTCTLSAGDSIREFAT